MERQLALSFIFVYSMTASCSLNSVLLLVDDGLCFDLSFNSVHHSHAGTHRFSLPSTDPGDAVPHSHRVAHRCRPVSAINW